MPKFKVKPGHTVTVGGEDEDSPQKVYRAGETVELDAEQAESMPWAVEAGSSKSKSRKQAPGSVFEAIDESARKRRAKSLRERDKEASEKNKGDLEGALDSIRMRPDNPASGVPAYGKVPQDTIDAFEASLDAEESEITDEMATDAGLDKGFGREHGGTAPAGTGGATGDQGQGPKGEGTTSPADQKPKGK